MAGGPEAGGPRAPLQALSDPGPRVGYTHIEGRHGRLCWEETNPLDIKGPPGKEGSPSKGCETPSLPHEGQPGVCLGG